MADDAREDYKAAGIAVACGVGIAAVGLLIALASAVVFHAKTYAGIMAVTEKEAIADDLPSAETTSSIALMDTDSAAKLETGKSDPWRKWSASTMSAAITARSLTRMSR